MSSTYANFLSCKKTFIFFYAFRVTSAHFIREFYNTTTVLAKTVGSKNISYLHRLAKVTVDL